MALSLLPSFMYNEFSQSEPVAPPTRVKCRAACDCFATALQKSRHTSFHFRHIEEVCNSCASCADTTRLLGFLRIIMGCGASHAKAVQVRTPIRSLRLRIASS